MKMVNKEQLENKLRELRKAVKDNFYEVLQIDWFANTREIKKACDNLLLDWIVKPNSRRKDKIGNSSTDEESSIEIEEENRIIRKGEALIKKIRAFLSDPELKEAYDVISNAGKGNIIVRLFKKWRINEDCLFEKDNDVSRCSISSGDSSENELNDSEIEEDIIVENLDVDLNFNNNINLKKNKSILNELKKRFIMGLVKKEDFSKIKKEKAEDQIFFIKEGTPTSSKEIKKEVIEEKWGTAKRMCEERKHLQLQAQQPSQWSIVARHFTGATFMTLIFIILLIWKLISLW